MLMYCQSFIDNESYVPGMHAWNATNGVLGLSYPVSVQMQYYTAAHLSSNTTFFNILANLMHSQGLFALDFRYNNRMSESTSSVSDGVIDIGGVSSTYMESLVWGELYPAPTPQAYTLPIFHLSVCGVDILSNYSSHWDTLIDTGAVCLTLPQPFFDNLMSWIPSECVTKVVEDNVLSQTTECYVPQDVNPYAMELPWLSFHATEYSPAINIRLNDLLIYDDNSQRYKYCILRGSTVNSAWVPQIVFGSMVVAGLYVVFDTNVHQIGFSNKHDNMSSLMTAGLQQCKQITLCQGNQEYYAAGNICKLLYDRVLIIITCDGHVDCLFIYFPRLSATMPCLFLLVSEIGALFLSHLLYADWLL